MGTVAWLDTAIVFPSIDNALAEPNGLLAAGGDLSVERLIHAYQRGIFPWFEQDQPILWWSPEPRSVVIPGHLKISRSLARTLRGNRFEVRCDTQFSEVIRACAEPRSYSNETWISPEMIDAYIRLHHEGYAHSIEVYAASELVGGLYGVSLGRMFFGESMFHRVTDASKVAFAYLDRLMLDLDCPLIDCQIPNAHLDSLGANTISRSEFKRYLAQNELESNPIDWQLVPEHLPSW